MKSVNLHGLQVLFTLFICISTLHAQDESTIRTILREADLKKLEKAENYKTDAEVLIGEANRLNMEVFSVQADPDLDEKSIAKKVKQLETAAREKQVEASALYEKCNEIKFSLYKLYIEEFWKQHEDQEADFLNAKLLEEQASDHYFQAITYRLEARKMDDGYARIEKLTEADGLEEQAIQKQVTALAQYHGIDEAPAVQNIPVETAGDIPDEEISVSGIAPDTNESVKLEAQPSEIPISEPPSNETSPTNAQPLTEGNIQINQSMIDAYNRYVATGKFTDTSLATGAIAGVTSFDSDRLLQLWYEYIYGSRTLFTDTPGEVPEENNSDTLQESPVVVTELSSDNKEKEIGIITDENKAVLIPADDEVIFRVQIAANRTELTQRALGKMYYGNKNVEMINENGWYKYSVGDFSSYEEASEFRKSSGISNALVVAYRKGTMFSQSIRETNEIKSPVYTPSGETRLPSGIIFRIQVAASRVPLTVAQLKRIYGGTNSIEVVSEDGWYKYQFMGVRLYSDALQIVRNVATEGAFIVAYEDGKKIELADAVKKTREIEKNVKLYGRKGQITDIELHVQIAASRRALPSGELASLYGGDDPVSVIIEEGWYKYHLKAGNSPQAAEQLRLSCNVQGAFIVPYQRAAKIGLFEAIRQLKDANH